MSQSHRLRSKRQPQIPTFLLLAAFLTHPVFAVPYARTPSLQTQPSTAGNARMSARPPHLDDLTVLLLNPNLYPHYSEEAAIANSNSDIGPSLSHPLLLTPRRRTDTLRTRPDVRSSDSANSLASLQIPTCALQCYITALTIDGCASETDFTCHCTTGDILNKAASCVAKNCNTEDEADAKAKVEKACEAVGGSAGSNDRNDGKTSSTQESRGSTASPTSSASNTPDRSSASPDTTSAAPNSPSLGTTPAPAPTPTSISTLPSLSTSSPSTTPPMPTDTPLALLPTTHPLSPAAKAGIALSVSLLTLSILITITLYIRRLKRELRAAQAAAAGVPPSVWRASMASQTATAAPASRRNSFRRSRRRSRGRSGDWGTFNGDDDGPVSPLSPTGGGVLRKKRGHVLSVVVEREDEDRGSSSMERMVREPVPGQKEGLVDPLELDAGYVGVVELPTSVTPRARSMERARGRSVGESSRPSTGEMEMIEEKRGV